MRHLHDIIYYFTSWSSAALHRLLLLSDREEIRQNVVWKCFRQGVLSELERRGGVVMLSWNDDIPTDVPPLEPESLKFPIELGPDEWFLAASIATRLERTADEACDGDRMGELVDLLISLGCVEWKKAVDKS